MPTVHCAPRHNYGSCSNIVLHIVACFIQKSPLQDAVEYGYIDTAVVLVENNARVTSELFMEIVEKGYK